MVVEEAVLKTFHTAPLLSAGSGVTRRYCGTPEFAYGALLGEAKKQLSAYDREARGGGPLVAEMPKDRAVGQKQGKRK